MHGTPEYNINGEYYFINGNNLVKGRVVIIEETIASESSIACPHNEPRVEENGNLKETQ